MHIFMVRVLWRQSGRKRSKFAFESDDLELININMQLIILVNESLLFLAWSLEQSSGLLLPQVRTVLRCFCAHQNHAGELEAIILFAL